MSLLEAVIRAQSGYRSDVAALGEALASYNVFAPLGQSPGLAVKYSQLGAKRPTTVQTIVTPDGTHWIPLFAGIDALHREAARRNWSVRGSQPQFIACNGRTALGSTFAPLLEEGNAGGIVFDLGQPSELALSAAEVLSLARGKAMPLVGSASRHPARGNEQTFIGGPAVPPPDDLLKAISETLRTESLVSTYKLRQVFIPERDLMPHLMLDIKARVSQRERRRISQRVGAAINGLDLSPPGYLDIAFNFADG